ncbi:MAG: aspartate 1-decarboxylase, partial [Verrucomicrobiota bacterium]
SDLVEKADLWPGQRVLVVSNTTGERLETYIIPEPAGSGEITMPGGAARRIGRGKEIIILGFALSEAAVEAKCALVDAENRFVRYL